MDELNTLKVRIFDLTETVNGMQAAINKIAEASGFQNGSVDDLISHIEELKGLQDDGDIKNVAPKAADRDTNKRGRGRRAG